MRIPTTLVTGCLALTMLGGACSDDDTPVTAGDDPGGGRAVDEVPDRAPDLVGTITDVEPFEPITEDCTPPEDLDPEGAVSSDDPPVCTPADNDIVGTILVAENPDEPMGGRKISYTVTTSTAIAGQAPGGPEIEAFDDLAEGQKADTWVAGDGACAESYPEQCGLGAIRVTG